MTEEYTTADLNPRSQAVKSLETTVVRCLHLIEEFDKLAPGDTWMEVPMAKYRTILGTDHYNHRNVIAEVFKRWEDGTLYRQVLDLYAQLPPDIWKLSKSKHETRERQKELKWRNDGIARASLGTSSRSKRPAVRPTRRAGGTKR